MDQDTKPKPTETVRQQRNFAHALILKIAAATSVEISEATQAVYLETLLSFDPAKLKTAVGRVIREWDKPHMMPPLAFIISRIENKELEAEQAWEFLQTYMRRHWHPDIGPYQGAPELPPATAYAMRQCGGLHRIHDADDKQFGFIRKAFLDSHQRFAEERGEQVRLTEKQAVGALASLRKGQLPEGWKVQK